MADTARGKHVSTGIYSKEEVMSYAVKSLGITTLGAVGETQKGPAFQVMNIADWSEFQSMFGGTSAEKYKGNKYPKYELPYIAKSYLNQSHQLQVVRVLGLSGYNAGPAWLVTANLDGTGEKSVVAVIRSRGTYGYMGNSSTENDCECRNKTYDVLNYYVGEPNLTEKEGCVAHSYNMWALQISPYVSTLTTGDECSSYEMASGSNSYYVSTLNKGRFSLEGVTGRRSKTDSWETTDKESGYFKYPVSLNPGDPDYILKVLGTNPNDGDAPIYVESLYDVALDQAIADGTVDRITDSLEEYNAYKLSDYCHLTAVNSLLDTPEAKLSRRYVGRRYLATGTTNEDGVALMCHKFDYTTGKPVGINSESEAGKEVLEASEEAVTVGRIYTVMQYTHTDGKRYYFYGYYDPTTISAQTIYNIDVLSGVTVEGTTVNNDITATLVKNSADGLYYRMSGDSVSYVSCDLNDYRSSYRYASTPWIVSNLKGDFNKLEVNKMFRFHTISDGNNSNDEVKVSIENILPDEGLFDVVVRDINDTDASTVVLEKFGKCSMVPGESNFISYRIGSFDGTYEAKSKYITVEINESTAARNSVPAGFIGYPLPMYDGLQIVDGDKHDDVQHPALMYNTSFDEDTKNKRQYFGLSDITGVDIDTFTYKGRTAYIDDPRFVCKGFHLDCRVNPTTYADKTISVSVDGETGYTFEGVSVNSVTSNLPESPIIAKESEMEGSIYEYKNLRKFTVYFYGGFDGWDEYRTSRTNTDEFKLTKYKGQINTNSGEGSSFDKIADPDLLNLNQNGITSDWYAYLSGIRQFANPSVVDINVFVTPGIDMINNDLLVQETIDMIEDERADSIYIATMPDKPSGAGDFVDEMYTAEDVADAIDEYDYDSNYTATYYPWIKYEDTDNSQYIYLPPTKDVVRNLAQTDNTYQPWFAPAGMNRGAIDAVRTKKVLKLAEEDELYEHGINPIKTFSTDGTVKVWGQKTIQLADNQLNRIATRRLLLRLRKLIAIATIGFIFDPNDTTTAESLRSATTPILENLRSNRGLSDYKLKIDDSVEMRENYELGVTIYLKAYTQLEYISLNFVLTPQGVDFEDL